MARKAIVDRDEVLRMLQEGNSTQSVADHFGVTRQAIDLHRRDFIDRGLLRNERAGRVARPVPAALTGTAAGPATVTTTTRLDDLIDLVIRAFTALKRVPELEAELDQSRRDCERLRDEFERLRTEADRRRDQELRWKSALGRDVPKDRDR